MYGGRLQLPAACSAELGQYLRNFKRQALHARRLALAHPVDNKPMSWEMDRPKDMDELLTLLSDDI
jgi:23S rRNA pseudouridine1911/1915/1917 synthase